MQCKNCGRDVKSDFKYCPYCANRLINDFEDHYSELNPPYVMPDLTDQQPDDAAFLYGRARVIPDETDAFFAPEQTAVPLENLNQPSDLCAKAKRPLPYEIYRPGDVDEAADVDLPNLPDLPEEDFAPELQTDSAPHESFRANLPDALPDFPDLPDLPDSPDLPDLPDISDDLLDLPEDEFIPDPQAYSPLREQPPHIQPLKDELQWETQPPDDQPEEQHRQTLEDAPYVQMQPDIQTQTDRVQTDGKRSTPGMAIKLLLIIFMVLLGVLASFLLYRFWGGLHIVNQAEIVPSAIASCWKPAWGIHYFL